MASNRPGTGIKDVGPSGASRDIPSVLKAQEWLIHPVLGPSYVELTDANAQLSFLTATIARRDDWKVTIAYLQSQPFISALSDSLYERVKTRNAMGRSRSWEATLEMIADSIAVNLARNSIGTLSEQAIDQLARFQHVLTLVFAATGHAMPIQAANFMSPGNSDVLSSGESVLNELIEIQRQDRVFSSLTVDPLGGGKDSYWDQPVQKVTSGMIAVCDAVADYIQTCRDDYDNLETYFGAVIGAARAKYGRATSSRSAVRMRKQLWPDYVGSRFFQRMHAKEEYYDIDESEFVENREAIEEGRKLYKKLIASGRLEIVNAEGLKSFCDVLHSTSTGRDNSAIVHVGWALQEQWDASPPLPIGVRKAGGVKDVLSMSATQPAASTSNGSRRRGVDPNASTSEAPVTAGGRETAYAAAKRAVNDALTRSESITLTDDAMFVKAAFPAQHMRRWLRYFAAAATILQHAFVVLILNALGRIRHSVALQAVNVEVPSDLLNELALAVSSTATIECDDLSAQRVTFTYMFEVNTTYSVEVLEQADRSATLVTGGEARRVLSSSAHEALLWCEPWVGSRPRKYGAAVWDLLKKARALRIISVTSMKTEELGVHAFPTPVTVQMVDRTGRKFEAVIDDTIANKVSCSHLAMPIDYSSMLSDVSGRISTAIDLCIPEKTLPSNFVVLAHRILDDDGQPNGLLAAADQAWLDSHKTVSTIFPEFAIDQAQKDLADMFSELYVDEDMVQLINRLLTRAKPVTPAVTTAAADAESTNEKGRSVPSLFLMGEDDRNVSDRLAQNMLEIIAASASFTLIAGGGTAKGIVEIINQLKTASLLKEVQKKVHRRYRKIALAGDSIPKMDSMVKVLNDLAESKAEDSEDGES